MSATNIRVFDLSLSINCNLFMLEIVTTKVVASALQVSEDTVILLIKRGELFAERLGERGRYRISKESLAEYAKRQKVTLKTQMD